MPEFDDSPRYRLSQLDFLESEAISIIREVAAENEHPAMLFSGGKDSSVMLHLAAKAFAPGHIPFPLVHIDTGHNFAEVSEFRDRRVAESGHLTGRRFGAGCHRLRSGARTGQRIPQPDSNPGVVGNGTGEWLHRAHGRCPQGRRKGSREGADLLFFRDELVSGTLKDQRPELWSLYNARINQGESVRVFPISNWTELDVWEYIAREHVQIPSIYYAHEASVFVRNSMLFAVDEHLRARADEEVFTASIRHRTVGDATLTAAVTRADTPEKVAMEVAASRITERGATRGGRPGQRGGDGGPQEGRLLLMEITSGSPRRVPSTTAKAP